MTPIQYLAAELEATLAGFTGAYTAAERFLLLAMVLGLAGLLSAVVVAGFRREPWRRRRSALIAVHRPAERTRRAYLHVTSHVVRTAAEGATLQDRRPSAS